MPTPRSRTRSDDALSSGVSRSTETSTFRAGILDGVVEDVGDGVRSSSGSPCTLMAEPLPFPLRSPFALRRPASAGRRAGDGAAFAPDPCTRPRARGNPLPRERARQRLCSPLRRPSAPARRCRAGGPCRPASACRISGAAVSSTSRRCSVSRYRRIEVIGVFNSCVTALMKLSCCSLRRISRTRKTVLRIRPRMMATKKTTPKKSRTPLRQLRMIQLTLSATADGDQADAQDHEKGDFPSAASDLHGAFRDCTAADGRIPAEIVRGGANSKRELQIGSARKTKEAQTETRSLSGSGATAADRLQPEDSSPAVFVFSGSLDAVDILRQAEFLRAPRCRTS